MQRIHLIGVNDLVALSGGTAHAVLPEYLDRHLLYRFYREHRERGDSIYFIPYASEVKPVQMKKVLPVFHVSHVVLFAPLLQSSPSMQNIRMLESIKRLRDNGYEPVVVVPSKQVELNYEYLSQVLPAEVALGFSCEWSPIGNGYGRYRTIRKLVEEHKLKLNRNYYLWELENPAELAIYGECFTPMIRRLFAGFFSQRCYIDSLYGIEYSPSVGLMHLPIVLDGLSSVSYLYAQQTGCFFSNDDLMKSFTMGRLGEGLRLQYEKAVKGANHV